MENRKTKTSAAVKARYNKKAYGIITAYIPKDLAEAFKARCAEEGISQAQVVKKAIEEYLAIPKAEN